MTIILPSLCWGGGPPQAVEGFFGRPENPSTSFAGPPPHEIVGRMRLSTHQLGFPMMKRSRT